MDCMVTFSQVWGSVYILEAGFWLDGFCTRPVPVCSGGFPGMGPVESGVIGGCGSHLGEAVVLHPGRCPTSRPNNLKQRRCPAQNFCVNNMQQPKTFRERLCRWTCEVALVTVPQLHLQPVKRCWAVRPNFIKQTIFYRGNLYNHRSNNAGRRPTLL